MRHTHYRGCEEWRSLGFQFSTASNEAVKLYDASVSQVMGMYDEPSVGGMEATLKGMLEADPNWVMGHQMVNILHLLGCGPITESFQKQMDTMNNLVEGPKVTPTEMLHVKACRAFAESDFDRACDIWNSILMLQPLDQWALRNLYTTYIYLGYSVQMRDLIARILPFWDEKMPNYGYLHGLYAFGLNETNMFDQAAKNAKKALEINEKDIWATHSMAHVFEMQGKSKQGISFMQSTEKDWTTGDMLACHNYWHLALYHVEQGNYEEALGIFDSELITRAKSSQSLFNMSDVSALLFRLRLEGVDVAERWSDVYELASPHIDDNSMAFHYPHIMFACIGAEDIQAPKRLVTSIENFVKNGKGKTQRVAQDVGFAICDSLEAYSGNDFAQAVEKLFPIRYKIWQIGGSHAQRDVLNLYLIHCAMKSPREDHQTFARQLLYERKATKEDSPMTERLLTKIVQSH